MKELAYHILDIANNSIRGEANNLWIVIDENKKENRLTCTIEDDGKGIKKEVLEKIKDPFTTSRTMRKVGLGIPFLNDTCLRCNGGLTIESKVHVGTKVTAWMENNNIDRPPLGNIASTITTLLTSEPVIHITYTHKVNQKSFSLSTQQLQEILGEVPLNQVEVVLWIKEYIKENISSLYTP